MPRPRSAETDGRRARLMEQARREKKALTHLDQAAARLAAAQRHRDEVLAEAEATVTEAERAHTEAMAAYASCATPQRAAFLLEVDRDLRRLVRELAVR